MEQQKSSLEDDQNMEIVEQEEQQIVEIVKQEEVKMNKQEKDESKQLFFDLGNRYDTYKLQPVLPEDADQNKKHLYNKLKNDQIIKPVLDEDVEHFTCQVCENIVKQPLECNTCSGLACADCFQFFMKDGNRVNMRCPVNLNGQCTGMKDQKHTKLNQFVSRHLNALKFKCQHEECESIGKDGAIYEDAVIHIRKCFYTKFGCPYGCAELKNGILGKDLDEHFKICPSFKETCPKCRISFNRSDIKSHDCMTELKKLVKVQNHQIDDISGEFGLVTHKFAPKCNRGHILQLVRGRVMEYNGTPQCDRCRQSQLHYHEALYHCQQCKFDLCRACALIQNKVLAVSQKTCIHDCNLEKQPSTRGNGWRCDARRLRTDDKGCESGVTDYYQPQGLQNWRCTACDYDLCIKCIMKYKNLDIKTLSDYSKTQLLCMVSGNTTMGTFYHKPENMDDANSFCHYHKEVKSKDKPIQYLVIENNKITNVHTRDDCLQEFNAMVDQAIVDGLLIKDKPIYSQSQALTSKYRVYFIGKTEGENDPAGTEVKSYIFSDQETANKYLTNSIDAIEQYFMVKDHDIQESLDVYNDKFNDEYYEKCMQQAMADGFMKD